MKANPNSNFTTIPSRHLITPKAVQKAGSIAPEPADAVKPAPKQDSNKYPWTSELTIEVRENKPTAHEKIILPPDLDTKLLLISLFLVFTILTISVVFMCL